MIKQLAKCIKQYKLPSILAPIFVVCEVIMEVIIPLVMARLIDYGIQANGQKGDMAVIWQLGGALVLLAILSLSFGFASGHFASKASSGFAANLRESIYNNVQRYDFANIDKFSTPSIITRLTNDVSRVEMAYQQIIRGAFRAPVMLIMALVMAFSVNSKVALVFVGIAPVLLIGLYLLMSRVHPVFKKLFKTYDVLNRVVQENLIGIRVVKSFVREDLEKKKFKDVSKDVADLSIKAEKIMAFSSPLMQFAVYTCMLLLSWFGAKMIVASGNNPAVGMTTGALSSMFTYTMQILMSLMMLSMLFVMIVMSRASAERIAELLAEEPALRNHENPICEVKDGSVDFENVSFSYTGDNSNPCLIDINLHMKSGQTVGVLGGTGSSKSTLVQLIPRFYDATSGAIYVGGVNVKDYEVEHLRNKVAMVLQKNVLFSGTIKENLRWGNPNASDEQMKKVCEMAQADGFISEFPEGYDTYIEQGGANVSGGQKQRLCIARALLKEPKILIMDDSTSAVDTKTDKLIRENMKKAMPGVTKIIIAQRVSSVENADVIIVMDQGRINGIGTHKELLENNQIYKQVYESQTKGAQENA